MYTNIEDVQSGISEVQTLNQNYPQNMSDKMDNKEYNYSLQVIEEQLNSLYTKIRIIEDVDNYIREYITKLVHEKEEQFKENLAIIEKASDLYTNKNYTAVTVPFTITQEIIKDRDGAVVKSMSITDATLQGNNESLSDVNVETVSYETNNDCYNNSYSNLLENNPGMSCYKVKEMSKDGIIETITFTLETPTLCNFINAKPINCEIQNISIVDNNDVVSEINNGYFDDTTIKSVKITVQAKQCEKEELTGMKDNYNFANSLYSVSEEYKKANDQLIKQIELSRIQADKKYNVKKNKTNYDIIKSVNEQIRSKNILISGE